MRLGVHLPQWGPGAQGGGAVSVARLAEDIGLDSVWVADHVVFPLGGSTDYPYSRDGSTPFTAEDGFLEALTVLAAVAGATERVQLGTSVLVLPMRDPLLTAKTVATLDQLCEGRVLLGIGAGWWAEEFAALGAEFHRRGTSMEECIEILRLLWAEGEAAYDGRYHSFDRLACRPLPAQPGGPPLLLGGTSPRALQRAGRLGDGWQGIGGRPEPLAASMAEVRRAATEAGRDADALALNTVTRLPETEEHVERLAQLAQTGVDHVVMGAPSPDPDECRRALERFGADLLPLLQR